ALGPRVLLAVSLSNGPFCPAMRRRAKEATAFRGYPPGIAPSLPDDDLFREIERARDETEALGEATGVILAETAPGPDEVGGEVDVPVTERILSTFKGLRGRRSPEKELMRRVIGSRQREPGIANVMLASLNIVQDRLARMRMAGDPPD